jgi:hybrid cluster-associated redox disulfide protein
MRVTSEMMISEVLASCPGSARVFEQHGLGCAGCLAASMESVSAVAVVHDVSVDRLLEDLNRLAPECGESGKES